MRIGIVTMGCDKNTVDNEYLAGLLAKEGAEVLPVMHAEEDSDIDAVIITTCAFTESAREENIERIIEWAEHKKQDSRMKRLYLSGCLAQRFSDDLIESIPEIDGLVGVGQWQQLAKMIATDHPEIFYPRPDREKVLVDIKESLPRTALDERAYAYLKISDGCNHKCSFCSIPLMKGRLSSVPKETLLDETRALIDRGVKEINLVAQDTADYGRDIYKDYRIDRFVEDLLELPGDFRLRLLYMYPVGITDRMIDLLANHPKLCKYLDMPLQHLDKEIMRSMRRPHREIYVEELIEKLRGKVPDIALRTTFIVGFPNETQAAFNNLLMGIERIRFDWLGAFTFSQEPGTPSAEFPDQLDEEIKQARYAQLMEAQQKIAETKSQQRINTQERVLIEGIAESPANWYVGRSQREAPEVDGLIFIESDQPLTIGQWANVKITSATTYDLFAKAI